MYQKSSSFWGSEQICVWSSIFANLFRQKSLFTQQICLPNKKVLSCLFFRLMLVMNLPNR